MSTTPIIPRPEFPNPQFERPQWLNLNGEWQFEFDHGDSGLDRRLFESAEFPKRINVPFCFESPLSGINIKDFCECVWYRRTVELPKDWDTAKGTVLLRFGAVDYYSQVWVNGGQCGCHRGGLTPFCFDVTGKLRAGGNTIVLRAEDKLREGDQPGGKQSMQFHSNGCMYTRTTGVWQTVWLEYIPAKIYIKSFRLTPNVADGTLNVAVALSGAAHDGSIAATAAYSGRQVSEYHGAARSNSVNFTIKLSELHLWQPGRGELYDLQLTYADGTGKDAVNTYFGMRELALCPDVVRINGEAVFQRLVLDQGFYPDGIWTAPDEQALKRDIELSMAAGFNGARLHQKIFEPRFLYWADRLGYIVWGEHASWGLNMTPASYENFTFEWMEALQRDFNHPAIVGWCPFNETWDNQRPDTLAAIYRLTKAFDPTRPVIDTSGYIHVLTDIHDVHDYDQNPATFKERYQKTADGSDFFINNTHQLQCDVKNLPYFVSEFGGIWWSEKTGAGWGYGERVKGLEDFYTRLEGLCDALLDNPRVFAYCYTQLTDVEQEQNGIYYYDRTPKFDAERLHGIFAKPAAIEKK